jgi:acyl carrier protein
MPTPELKQEVKQLIIDSLEIPDVTPEQIDDTAPIMMDNLLALDSVDALELVVALQRKYGVRIDDQNLARNVLHSIDTIAEFVENNRAQ